MDEVFGIRKDFDKSRALHEMAKDRFNVIIKAIPKDKYYKIIEEYYEIIKELLTAVMYIDGYKTLSHVHLINYFSSNYNELDENKMRLTDRLRKLRIDIVYYGKNMKEDFLVNYEKDIKEIINVLLKVVERKLKNE